MSLFKRTHKIDLQPICHARKCNVGFTAKALAPEPAGNELKIMVLSQLFQHLFERPMAISQHTVYIYINMSCAYEFECVCM